jgi:hypothetical protein
MKLKLVAAAVAMMSVGGAFAATPAVTCAPTTLAGLVNTCAPEVTFYMGGASAQAGALNTLLAAGTGIFDTTAPRGKIGLMTASISGLNGVTTTDITKSNTVGYIGIGAADTPYATKRVLVIYNKANGSAAGVNQLLTGKGTGAGEETTLITASAKLLSKGTPGTCSVVTDSTAGSLGTVSCATEAPFKSAWGADKAAQKNMHMALSDVRPSELSPGIVKKWDAVKYPSVTTGMQGFGVIVNPALYTALIAKDVAAGRLAADCATSQTVGGATDVITAACVPNMTSADMASVMGGKVNAEGLTGVTGKTLTLARRVASSGTQASAQLMFAGQAAYNVKTPAADGFMDLATGAAKGSLDAVLESAGTGDVITAVSAPATDYAVGVVSIENTYSMTKTSSKLKGALFVKVNGMAPHFNADGTTIDAKHRTALQAGYPFAFEMQAIASTSLADPYLDIANKIKTALKDPAQNLAGIAYIGSTDATKNTAYTRSGNNYLPLSK